jgi:hypothetical protein
MARAPLTPPPPHASASCASASRTTPPESIADCIVKLRLATQAVGDRDDDWTSLHQVGEFMDGG